ncbi:hypothetical protein CTP10_R79800 (plasmid) [Cupriavidus sp. P-10]|nr:hypothetical protein CTP10_R79800 [Cupriavidus sp. P-10]
MLMILWANDFRAVFWVAVIPGILSVLLLMGGGARTRASCRRQANQSDQVGKPCPSRLIVASHRDWGAVYACSLQRGVLVLRAQQVGLPPYLAPLVLVEMNVVYSLSAYPFGKLSDRLRHTTLLAWGLVILILAHLVLAMSTPPRTHRG